MPNPDFEKLVRKFAEQQQKEAAQAAVDWHERKTWWIKRVRQLFDQIGVWLQPLIESGVVQFKRSMMPAHEENIGPYDIEWLELRVVEKKLTFLPVGTLLLRASGRIDASGPTGDISLVLIEADTTELPQERRAQATWFIRHPSLPVPRSRSDLRPLNESTFEELFADLFGIPR